MASQDLRLPDNAPGDFFVDETCIDCDACRWIAPSTFEDGEDDHSRVYRQPDTPEETRRALMALVACPTASIGTGHKHDMKPVLASFPDPVDGPVYHCGYHDESSFGAASWLVVRPGGNILVDSPRFAKPLVKNIEALGGVTTMFLTHRDDVADHVEWAAHFGCERILHAGDVTRGTRDVERVIEGTDPVALDDEVTLLPVPGHTRGSMCLVFRQTYLFSGDHVAFSRRLGHVYAFRQSCWYDWKAQIASMERLMRHRFEWILPGHGRSCHFDAERMAGEMDRCVAWMKGV